MGISLDLGTPGLFYGDFGFYDDVRNVTIGDKLVRSGHVMHVALLMELYNSETREYGWAVIKSDVLVDLLISPIPERDEEGHCNGFALELVQFLRAHHPTATTAHLCVESFSWDDVLTGILVDLTSET